MPSGVPSVGRSSGPSSKPSQSQNVVLSSAPSVDPSSNPSTVPSLVSSSEPSTGSSSMPSPVPTIDCSNDLDFKFEGDLSRTCDSYVAYKPVKRCKKIQPKSGGKKVRKFCPGTCKKKCKKPRGECENLLTFRFQGNWKFSCDLYVALKPVKRCKKDVEGTNDKVTGKLKKVRFFCPATCKRKCKTL